MVIQVEQAFLFRFLLTAESGLRFATKAVDLEKIEVQKNRPPRNFDFFLA